MEAAVRIRSGVGPESKCLGVSEKGATSGSVDLFPCGSGRTPQLWSLQHSRRDAETGKVWYNILARGIDEVTHAKCLDVSGVDGHLEVWKCGKQQRNQEFRLHRGHLEVASTHRCIAKTSESFGSVLTVRSCRSSGTLAVVLEKVDGRSHRTKRAHVVLPQQTPILGRGSVNMSDAALEKALLRPSLRGVGAVVWQVEQEVEQLEKIVENHWQADYVQMVVVVVVVVVVCVVAILYFFTKRSTARRNATKVV